MNNLLTALKTLLSAQFGTTFKHYIVGTADMKTVPKGSFPSLVITAVSTEIVNSGTVKDENNYTIQVRIVDDVRKYFDNITGAWGQQDWQIQHATWLEDRETNGDLKATSIAGVIRDNITLTQNALFNNNLNIEYATEQDGTMAISTLTFTAQDRTTR
jgi:hypothetical protein